VSLSSASALGSGQAQSKRDEPDDAPIEEREPILCDGCGDKIPDGQPVVYQTRCFCEWCSDVR
jgi:hypothetical protein